MITLMKTILILIIASCGTLLAMEISTEEKPKAEFKYRDFNSGEVIKVTKLITFPVFPKDLKPEPYKSIPEGCYFAADPSYGYALLGPLNPCIGIIIRDPKSRKIVIAHKDHAAKLDSLKDILIREFEPDCFPMLKITLYSEETHRDDETKMLINQAYNNRSQMEELKKTKDFLVELFKIQRDQVNATKYTPKFNGFQCDINVGLTSNLLIDMSNGKIFHIDPFERNLYSMFQDAEFIKMTRQKQLEHYSIYVNHLNCLASELMRGEKVGLHLKYDSTPFYSRALLDDAIDKFNG